MTNFWGFLQQIARLFVWWIIVTPWEQALRVRSLPGRQRIRRLAPGLHLRLPVVDSVYKQSVRLRMVSLPMQTLTTRDGATLTCSGLLGYCIRDLEKLYQTLHHAEDTIRNKASGAIAQYVQTHDRRDCTPAEVAEGALGTVDLGEYGLNCEALQLSDFAFLRAYRFIMDQKWSGSGDYLNTQVATSNDVVRA